MPSKEQLIQKVKNLPEKPGVYKMVNRGGEIIYIGASKNLKKRVSSYFRTNNYLEPKIQQMIAKIDDFDYEIHHTIDEAFLRERELIRIHRPKYNTVFLDAKEYPFIQITMPPREKFSRLLVARKVEKNNDYYFERKIDVKSLRYSVRILRQIFPLANKSHCLRTKKPCLDYKINRCLGPCAGKISIEEYQKVVSELILFLQGKRSELLNHLFQEMEAAAKRLDFETAAIIRDKITKIEKIIEKSPEGGTQREKDIIVVIESTIDDEDNFAVLRIEIADDKVKNYQSTYLMNIEKLTKESILESFISNFYLDEVFLPAIIELPFPITRHQVFSEWLTKKKQSIVDLRVNTDYSQEVKVIISKVSKELTERAIKEYHKKKFTRMALKQLLSFLKLKKIPKRIEAYDISNIQGELAVASMVVMIDGYPSKRDYRRFKMRTKGPNDVAMMREVLYRRLTDSTIASTEPDLIVIDGGIPQVNAAYQILKKLKINIPAIGLAKKEEKVFLPNRSTPVEEFDGSEALKLLQQIRDESHRFALTYHRKMHILRPKTVLESIPGVGKNRRNALLKHFGSLSSIKKATVDELAVVPGISRKVAEAIYLYFQSTHDSP